MNLHFKKLSRKRIQLMCPQENDIVCGLSNIPYEVTINSCSIFVLL